MPYITKEDRAKYDAALKMIKKIDTKGDLEYCIYKLMTTYMEDKKWSYAELHNTVYAAVHCGDEFRRRNLDAREDGARETNGEI